MVAMIQCPQCGYTVMSAPDHLRNLELSIKKDAFILMTDVQRVVNTALEDGKRDRVRSMKHLTDFLRIGHANGTIRFAHGKIVDWIRDSGTPSDIIKPSSTGLLDVSEITRKYHDEHPVTEEENYDQ